MSRLFLSHSSADNFEARALAEWLAEEGWSDVFLDIDPERGIAAGQRWERALHKAADRCEAVAFLISRAWLASGWCRKEYELARRLSKQLFAVIVERGLTLADLPPELTDAWQVTDLAGGGDHRMFAARLPGSEEERHVLFSRAGLDRLRAGLKQAGLDPREFPWPPEGAKDPAPYVGLRALTGDEAGLFFGRDADLVRALDRLRGLSEAAAPRIAVILGASGAGKSSFLRAGLLPRLARDDARFLVLPAIRPARDPLDGEAGLISALDAAVETPHARADASAAVARGAEGVREWLAPLVAAAAARTLGPRRPMVVVSVDQAEELFSADGDGPKLLGLLADLVRDDAPAVLLLFSIRSDAYDALERAKPLEGMAQETLPLLPMPRHAARAVIEGPAARYAAHVGKLDLDPRLTQALLDDLDRGGGRDALPLLAFTLERLWREWGRSGALTLAAYEAFGGLAGAIEAGVKRAYARADADPRLPRDEAARDALLRRGLVPWLAGIDPDTKAPRRNVARAADIPEEARPLIDLMVEERLLSRSVDEARVATLEPAHEALLRQWGKLKGWLEEDFALLAALEAAQRASRDWDANGRADAWLAHRGQRLAEAGALDARPDIAAKLDAQDRAYLAACRAHEDAQRAEAERVRTEREAAQARALADANAIGAANRRVARRTGAGLAVALLLALVAGGAAWVAKRQAQVASEQRGIAQKEAENAKAEQAEAEKQKAAAEAQRAAAENEKKIADRNLTTATETVNGLVLDVVQEFENISGARVEFIRSVLETTREKVEALMKTAPDNAQLAQTNAMMLEKFANIYLKAKAMDDAVKSAKAAYEVNRTRVLVGGNRAAMRDWVSSIITLGDVYRAKEEIPNARVAFREALNLLHHELETHPDNKNALQLLANAYDRTGLVEQSSGNLDAAQKNYQAALSTNQELLATNPDNGVLMNNIAASQQNIGETQLKEGDGAAAAQSFQLATDDLSALSKSFPHDTFVQDNLATALHWLAEARNLTGDAAGALTAAQAAIDLRKTLLTVDPSNSENEFGLAGDLMTLANARVALGDNAGAVDSLHKRSDMIAHIAQEQPDNISLQFDLAHSYEDVGVLHRKRGEFQEAIDDLNKGIEMELSAHAKTKDSQIPPFFVGDKLMMLADSYVQVGDREKAEATVQRLLAIGQKVMSDTGSIIDDRMVVLPGLGGAAAILHNLGDFAAEFSVRARQIEIARQFAKEGIQQRDTHNDEAGANFLLSMSVEFEKGGDKTAAAAARDEYEDARKRIVAEDPSARAAASLKETTNDLADALGAEADIAVLIRQPETALTLSEESIALRPAILWPYTNKAHALMFLHRTDEARAIYLGHRGENVNETLSWEKSILEDFAEFKKNGLSDPLMKEIEAAFAAPK